jgi:hypothetical protein
MTTFNEIRVVDDNTLVSHPTGAAGPIQLRDGAIVELDFSTGRLIGGTMRRQSSGLSQGFVMTLSSNPSGSLHTDLPAGGRTCYYCADDPEAGVCFCYPIPCEWILG